MKNKKIFQILLLIALLVLASFINVYYWNNTSLDSIVNVPMYIMILALGYVLIQILRRYLFKKQYWWDWLYYIGLAAIIVPPFLASGSDQAMYHFITDYGTLFLVIPVFLDGRELIKSK